MNATPLVCSDSMDLIPTGDVATADSSRAHYVIARLLIGLLLMFAGLGKIAAAQPILIASAWVIPSVAVIVWGLTESIPGWFVLSFVAHRWLRIVLTGMFGLFAMFLLLEWSLGATQCQCLGDNGLPILSMIGLDLVVFACLVIQHRWWDRPSSMSPGLLGDLALHSRFVLPILLAASLWMYGSPRSAIDYIAGKSVLVRSQQRFAGQVTPDETATTAFELRNVASRSIRVLGAKASCRCVAIDDLPLTLEPGESKPIRLRLVAGHTPGLQRESAELLFDDSASSITLVVTALVHPNP